MDAKIISILVLAIFIQLAVASPFGPCGENEWTNGCGSPCEETCEDPHINCIQVCSGNPCRCIAGHVRHNGRCIPLENCPKN